MRIRSAGTKQTKKVREPVRRAATVQTKMLKKRPQRAYLPFSDSSNPIAIRTASAAESPRILEWPAKPWNRPMPCPLSMGVTGLIANKSAIPGDTPAVSMAITQFVNTPPVRKSKFLRISFEWTTASGANNPNKMKSLTSGPADALRPDALAEDRKAPQSTSAAPVKTPDRVDFKRRR